MMNCDFNKVALQLHLEHLFKRAHMEGCFWYAHTCKRNHSKQKRTNATSKTISIITNMLLAFRLTLIAAVIGCWCFRIMSMKI